ncbi:MAG TPA: DinB family protein, partial [Spirochaetia bacterium]
MAELARAVREASEERLSGPVGPGGAESFAEQLAHLTLHAAHHIGQIVTLRKLQGTWDPKHGVS